MASLMLHSMKSLEDKTEHVNIDDLFDGMSLIREDCV